MSNPSFFYALALITCISSMAAPTLARLPEDSLAILAGDGVDSPVISQCLTGIRNVQGCVQEIISAFISLQTQILGPACCKAFSEIDETCLPQVFPYNLNFPVNLTKSCMAGDDSPPARKHSPPPPPPCSSDYDEGDEDCDYD